MPQISWLTDLTQASFAALFAATILLLTIGLWRRWVVMGWVYQDEVDRRKAAEQALAAQVAVTNAITEAYRDRPASRRGDARS